MKVLFTATGVLGAKRLATFQQADVDLLRALGHEVRVLPWYGRPILELLRGSRWADVVYCWNISDHAFLASFFARVLACVVGGYEFANLPECNYGNMTRRTMRALTKRVWRTADALLYVDPSLMDEATAAFGNPGRAHYLPTGYDAEYWTPGTAPGKNMVVTVCHAPTPETAKLKGLDLFVQVAQALPDVEFHHAGAFPASFVRTPNLVLHGWLDRDGIRELYRSAKVYCQLSLHEGLPNALCEAMLCGCVPVGTRVNGIPNAIGDAGFVVERDVDSITAGVRKAVSGETLGGQARARIAGLFPLERRRDGLRDILERLAAGPS